MEYNFEEYCKDYKNIENFYKAKTDNFVGWCCHHRKGADISAEELQALGKYYDIPAEELIFMTRAEHSSLHQKGKPKSAEHKKKLSEAMKGEKNPAYGKQYRLGKSHSDESKKKMSEAKKGNQNAKGHSLSEESKKKLSEASRINSTGRHWYHNDKHNFFCYECPPGCELGMLKRK